jgi:hypothetical protein
MKPVFSEICIQQTILAFRTIQIKEPKSLLIMTKLNADTLCSLNAVAYDDSDFEHNGY